MADGQLDEVGEVSGAHSLDVALSKRRSWQARVAQVSGVVLALVVVMGLVLHGAGVGPSLAWPWQGRAVDHNPPTGVFTIVSIHTNVNYGTITVNGKKQEINQFDNQVVLERKMNVVTVSAPPFRAITCTLPQVVPQQSDGSQPCASFGLNNGLPQVFMSFTPQQLSPDLTLSLPDLMVAEAAQISAQMQTQVPVGQHYAVGVLDQNTPLTAIAQEPLVAQVVLTIDPTFVASGIGINQGYFPFVIVGSNSWTINALVTLHWRFTRLNGTPVSSTSSSDHSSFAIPLALQFTTDHHWQVAGLDPQNRFSYLTYISQFLCIDNQLRGSFVGVNQTIGSGFLPGPSTIEGCVIHFQTPQVGSFVMRFGAWLAVDAGAHKLAPSLPLASAAEVTAAGG